MERKEMYNPKVFWSLLVHGEWKLMLAATEKGLCYAGVHEASVDVFSNWVRRWMTGHDLEQNDERLQRYAEQFIAYADGELLDFSLPIDLRGTLFQLTVWEALRTIPYGESSSYSDVASFIQKPASARAVGAAIGLNPILIAVPCHRVIGKNGSLTGYRGGLDMKTKLLQLEQERPNSKGVDIYARNSVKTYS
jgi:methylated-DNA-[protein]-cysteine S-methyltransferase